MTEAALSEGAVRDVVGAIIDPELGRSLADVRMLGGVRLAGPNDATVAIDLPTHAYPNRERLAALVRQTLQFRFPAAKVQIDFGVKVRGKDTGGALGLRVKNVIAVGSGKGGVGKSTIAASLAFGLQIFGAKVGLMDADVYGPSIPHMLGAHGKPAVIEQTGPQGQKVQRIQPVERDGLKVMSMGFFVPPDEAVIWRGPMLHSAITQFLKDTDWGELDYLIIDLPPGTGDVSLTLSQLLGLAGAVVVCTPQQVALLDAVKAVSMFRKVKIPVLGMVENMTGDIFGRGGARQKAMELGLPFLGEIPIDARLRINGDDGRLVDNFDATNPARAALLEMCSRVAIEVAKEATAGAALPTLELL